MRKRKLSVVLTSHTRAIPQQGELRDLWQPHTGSWLRALHPWEQHTGPGNPRWTLGTWSHRYMHPWEPATMLLPNCQTGGKPQKMYPCWLVHPILTGAPCQLARPSKKTNSNFLQVVILLGTTAWYKKPSCSESVSDDGATRFTGGNRKEIFAQLNAYLGIAPI